QIALRGVNQIGPLRDRERRRRTHPGNALFLAPEFIAMCLAQRRHRRPALAVEADVLPIVLAYRARRRRLGRGGIFDAAGHADPGRGHAAIVTAGVEWRTPCTPTR